jgi:hypothetical protein
MLRYAQHDFALSRAVKRTLRRFRYIFFIKRDWMRRLNFKVQLYPKRGET